MKDPVQCCQLAGVQPPTSAWQQCGIEPTKLQLTEMQEPVDDKNKCDQDEEIIVRLCQFVVSDNSIMSQETHIL